MEGWFWYRKHGMAGSGVVRVFNGLGINGRRSWREWQGAIWRERIEDA